MVEHGNVGKTTDKPRDKARSQTRVFAFGGDVDFGDETVYELYAHDERNRPIDDKSLACGHLRYFHAGKQLKLKLELDVSGFEGELAPKLAAIAESTAVRIGDAPNFLEGYLNKTPEVYVGARTALWFPLTPKQIRTLPRHIFAVSIELDSRDYLPRTSEHSRSYSYIELVERYFQIQSSAESFGSLGQQKRMWMSNIALALDKLVEKARGLATRTTAKNGGIDEIQADHWRHLTLDALTKKRIELDKGHFRSLLTLTQAILDGVGGDTLRNFERHLHMTSAGVHEYEAELELLPVDEVINDAHELGKLLRKLIKRGSRAAKRILRRIPAGALIGTLIVRKRHHGPFEARYVIILIGAKFSRSVGSGSGIISAKGVAKNSYGQAWRPEHIPGRVVFLELGASASGGGSGKGGSMTLMTCHGSGPGKPPSALGFNLSGLSDIMAVGAGGGVAFMYLHGWILPIDADGGDVDLAPLGKDTTFVYGAHSAVGPLHFPINGAKLTDEAAALLEIFACCELPVLSRKGVTVDVNGYADQPDDELNNKILSRNRAISVYHFLKNILGKELATPELNEIPVEKEERAEAIERRKKEMEATKNNKVPYVIFDPSKGVQRVTIVGHGAPLPPEDKKGKAQYDPDLRRADLSIDGEVRLSLRRANDE